MAPKSLEDKFTDLHDRVIVLEQNPPCKQRDALELTNKRLNSHSDDLQELQRWRSKMEGGMKVSLLLMSFGGSILGAVVTAIILHALRLK